MPSPTIRKLAVTDVQQARDLGAEAFGGWPPGVAPPPLPTVLPPGRHQWGAFDGDRLVAKVDAHEYASWWHGRRLPTCGIAGVAVAAEHRGGGLLRELFAAVLTEAVARGEVISTLYPTAPGIYRSLGYELIASYDTVEVPTAELGRVAAPRHTTTRRADAGDPSDLGAVRAVYDTWACAQNGPLTRTGPLFDGGAAGLPSSHDVTLAVDDIGDVTGFLTWRREEGYGPQGRLVVRDLVATSGDAYRALWRVAASFASVTGTVRLSTSGADPARLVLPSMTWDVVSRHPYMLRVLDVDAAFGALGLALPTGADATVRFAVRGDRLDVLDGSYVLTLGDGEAHPPDRQPGSLIYTPQGLALAFAGAQSSANLTLLGHRDGTFSGDRGASAEPPVLDLLLGGRQLHVRDYF